MMRLNRQVCRTLLCVLLLGHAALSVHMTTHIPVDQTTCDFCAGNADPTHAIPVTHDVLLTPNSSALQHSNRLPANSVAEPIAYRERAPPYHS